MSVTMPIYADPFQPFPSQGMPMPQVMQVCVCIQFSSSSFSASSSIPRLAPPPLLSASSSFDSVLQSRLHSRMACSLTLWEILHMCHGVCMCVCVYHLSANSVCTAAVRNAAQRPRISFAARGPVRSIAWARGGGGEGGGATSGEYTVVLNVYRVLRTSENTWMFSSEYISRMTWRQAWGVCKYVYLATK
jgi:hypothetical protein